MLMHGRSNKINLMILSHILKYMHVKKGEKNYETFRDIVVNNISAMKFL